MTDRVEIGGDASQLVLSLGRSAKDNERQLEANLRSGMLNAKWVVHEVAGAGKRGDFAALSKAFQSLADDWAGRSRDELWTSADQDLALSVDSDALGHISLVVELSEPIADGWRAQATVPLEPSDLPRVSAQLRSLLETQG